MPIYESIKIVINAVIIIIIGIIIFWLISEKRISKLDKRLGKYAISSKENSHSLFDYIIDYFSNIINYLNKIFSHSHLLVKYSYKYEKYVDKKKNSNITEMTFISIKVICSVLILILVVISDFLQGELFSFGEVFISLLVGFFLPDIFLISRRMVIKREIQNDLLKAITIMNNSFKSGRSIMQTVEIVSEELEGPLRDEFKQMVVDLNYGLTIENALERLQERVMVDDIKYISTSLTILNKTGGDIVKVFSSIEKTFFSNRKLEEEMKTLTASAKFLYYVLLVVPVVFVLIIGLLDPSYFAPLFSNVLGYMILFIIVSLYILYIIVVKRIMRIKE